MSAPDGDRVRLSASSAVILGLLGRESPQTTYEMMSYVELSIGYFWPFPPSQMYAETKRLEAAGLIEGSQEDFGRRRRQYSITDEGRVALEEWLREPAGRHTEIRDFGLLKLFIADAAPSVSVDGLIDEQVHLHGARLAEYEALAERIGSSGQWAEKTLELGLAFERVAIDFWESARRHRPS